MHGMANLSLDPTTAAQLARLMGAIQEARIAKGMLARISAADVVRFLVADASEGGKVKVPKAALRSDSLTAREARAPKTASRVKRKVDPLAMAMRARRMREKLSQEDVAGLFALTASNLAAFEAGRRGLPARALEAARRWADGGPAPSKKKMEGAKRATFWDRLVSEDPLATIEGDGDE